MSYIIVMYNTMYEREETIILQVIKRYHKESVTCRDGSVTKYTYKYRWLCVTM